MLRYNNGTLPNYGVIWRLITLTSWSNGAATLVVSTVIPRGVDACTNTMEFYCPEGIVLFKRDFVEAGKAAYSETALEDDTIYLKMHQGPQMAAPAWYRRCWVVSISGRGRPAAL